VRPLPPVVFDHYRNPRNEGVLDPADAIGCVEGRREDSRLRMFLRLCADRRIIDDASFLTENDRSCRASLSLVTSLIRGRPLVEVKALTVETVGAAFGLHDENLPMLVPALEALASAIATLDGVADPFLREGRVVCHCLFVREGRIRRAVQERGLRSVEEVQAWTRACTGCRSCRVEVQRIVDGERRRAQ
jgi:NifU-like protein involved in Fe-S cluster formation